MTSFLVRSAVLLGAVSGAIGLLAGRVTAQTPAACQPPQAGEYLMMVVNPTVAVQTQLQQVLPATSAAIVCTYLEDTVLRVDGFTDADTANSWAQYVAEQGEFEAFVARPATIAAFPTPTPAPTPATALPPATTFPQPAATPPATVAPADPAPPDAVTQSPASPATAPTAAVAPNSQPTVPEASPALPAAPAIPESTPATATATTTAAYNPQPLGMGYAVLVDYASRPEVAAEVGQLLAANVGLVVYAQRPYLLATYTSDPAIANSILQTLSDRNFAALIIDSQRAVLLAPAVR